jgi:hypothetical protein
VFCTPCTSWHNSELKCVHALSIEIRPHGAGVHAIFVSIKQIFVRHSIPSYDDRPRCVDASPIKVQARPSIELDPERLSVASNHHNQTGSKINLTIKRATSDVQVSGRSDEAPDAPYDKISSRDNLEPLAVSVDEAARLAGVSRTMLYQALRSGGSRSLEALTGESTGRAA